MPGKGGFGPTHLVPRARRHRPVHQQARSLPEKGRLTSTYVIRPLLRAQLLLAYPLRGVVREGRAWWAVRSGDRSVNRGARRWRTERSRDREKPPRSTKNGGIRK